MSGMRDPESGEHVRLGAPGRGAPRRRAVPQAPRPQSLSASERSHRRRLVTEAHEAVVNNLDDGVARLIERRKAAVALAERAHVDTTATRAVDQIERMVRSRERAANAAAKEPVEPATTHQMSAPIPEPATPETPAPAPEGSGQVTADAVTELARRRKAEVAAAAETPPPVDGSAVSRLLSRRSSEG